jgi:hypothetical protein
MKLAHGGLQIVMFQTIRLQKIEHILVYTGTGRARGVYGRPIRAASTTGSAD